MSSETFKEQLALRFLDKYLEEENVCSSETHEEETLENANQIADSIYLYVNAMIAAHDGQKLEIKQQHTAAPKPAGNGLLGLRE